MGSQVGGPTTEDLKFSELLTEDMQREVQWKQHYDLPGAAQILQELSDCVVLEYEPRK